METEVILQPSSPYGAKQEELPCQVPPAALPRHRQIDPGPCDKRPDHLAAAASAHACRTALEICSKRLGIYHHPTHVTSYCCFHTVTEQYQQRPISLHIYGLETGHLLVFC